MDNESFYVWDWNLQTGAIALSPNWSESLEIENEESGRSGNWLSSRIHPEDLPIVLYQLESHLSGVQEQDTFFFRLKNRESKYLSFESKGIIVMQNLDGKPEHVIWASQLIECRAG
jgi:PAS domain-containing protein